MAAAAAEGQISAKRGTKEAGCRGSGSARNGKAGGRSEPPANTIFASIKAVGHDEDFQPAASESFSATTAPAGSLEKFRVLRDRVRAGQPLWHPEDAKAQVAKTPDKVFGLRASGLDWDSDLRPKSQDVSPTFESSEKEFARC